MKRMLGAGIIVGMLVMGSAAASARAAATGQRPAAMGVSTVQVSVTAGPYQLTLVIGPLEHMYTLAQYQRLHPKSGEIMLRGTMSMGMGMHMANRHLELHVLDRRTMQPVANAMVTLSYEPVAPMGAMAMRPTTVPVVVMRGIGTVGMSDVHYGNNVYMPSGTYHVWAHANAAYATYLVRLT